MNTVVIFHCEFSQKRGPEMYSALRDIDRRLHMHCYPQIFFSEIYILEGGYKQFFANHPDLCEGGYVPMDDKNFKEDCRDQFSKHKANFQQFNAKRSQFECAAFSLTQIDQENVKSPSEFNDENNDPNNDDISNLLPKRPVRRCI